MQTTKPVTTPLRVIKPESDGHLYTRSRSVSPCCHSVSMSLMAFTKVAVAKTGKPHPADKILFI